MSSGWRPTQPLRESTNSVISFDATGAGDYKFLIDVVSASQSLNHLPKPGYSPGGSGYSPP